MISGKKFLFLLILLLQLPLFAQENLIELEQNIHLQILLDQAGFAPGEIDGKIGINTLRALHIFQDAHGLPQTGEADERTLDLLSASGKPTLRTYRLTEQDASALKGISERFHTSSDVFLVLNPDVMLVKGETVVVPNVVKRSSTLQVNHNAKSPRRKEN